MGNLPVGGYVKVLIPTAGYGGVASPLPPGSVQDDCINIPIGGKVFGFGSMLVDGTPTASPAEFLEEGYHVIQIIAPTGQRQVGVAVVDPTLVVAKIEDIIGEGVNESSADMADALPRPFLRAPNSRPGTFNSLSQVTVSANKAVVLTIQSRKPDDAYEDKGVVCCGGVGRWTSSTISLGKGFTRSRLLLRMSPSEITILPLPTNPVPVIIPPVFGVLTARVPIGFTSIDSKELTPSAGTVDDSWMLVDEGTLFPDGNTTHIDLTGSQGDVSWRVADYVPTASPILSVNVSYSVRREPTGVDSKVTVRPYLLHTVSNERAYGAYVSITEDVTYATFANEFLTNPFTGNVWYAGDLTAGLLHVGFERVTQTDGVALSAIQLGVVT